MWRTAPSFRTGSCRPAASRASKGVARLRRRVERVDRRRRQRRAEAVQDLRRILAAADRRRPCRRPAAATSPCGVPSSPNSVSRLCTSTRYCATMRPPMTVDVLDRLLALGDDRLPGGGRRIVEIDRDHLAVRRVLVRSAGRPSSPCSRSASTPHRRLRSSGLTGASIFGAFGVAEIGVVQAVVVVGSLRTS